MKKRTASPVRDNTRQLPFFRTLFVVAPFFFSAMTVCAAQDLFVVGAFSAAPIGNHLPENWVPLTFKNIERHTDYGLFSDGGTTVIRAVSRAASSGLIRKISIDPNIYPIIQWRWKITSVFKKGDVTRKAGDDYPARIYVTFAYDARQVGLLERTKFETARLLYGEYPPAGAINYIWASKAPAGTIIANPFTDRAMMVVVETGDDKRGTWITEQRNIVEDYRRAFGGAPPMISGVAIMTDTDNTGDSTISYFGDIVFKKAH